MDLSEVLHHFALHESLHLNHSDHNIGVVFNQSCIHQTQNQQQELDDL